MAPAGAGGTGVAGPGVWRVVTKVWLVLYGVFMAALIVGLDIAFFRGHFWPRLMINVGIVLVFGAVYLRFLRST